MSGPTDTRRLAACKAVVHQYLDDVWRQGNLDAIASLVAEDYIDHTPPPGAPADRAGLTQLVTTFHDAFTVTGLSVDALVAEGETVVDRWTLHARHTGPFLGRPPTNHCITLRGIDIHTVRAGNIVESWHIEDIAGLLRQLD